MASSSSCIIPLVDDFYFSALFDNEEIFPISDEKYAQELQLQEALMNSSTPTLPTTATTSAAATTTNHYISAPAKFLKGKEKLVERDESSVPHGLCEICTDAKPIGEMFIKNSYCSHSYCNDCISKYVASKLQENISTIKCPDMNCRDVLEAETCRSIVPKEVFERWEDVLCETLVSGCDKLYCPFKDCSGMLVVEEEGGVVDVSECPHCHRLFCAQCKVGWHAGIGCEEYRNLGKDERLREDVLLMQLAKDKEWMRCPKCKFFVEKVNGCLHINCRCGFEFCYGCGSRWVSTHACTLRLH